MDEAVRVFKALSDKTRLRIIWLLKKAGSELCVCEVTDSLNESQYNVSRHLKELKIAGLIQEKKRGRWVFYSLASPANQFQRIVLEAMTALSEDRLHIDYERLKKRLSFRKDGKCVIGMNSEEWRKMSNQLMARRR